MLKGSTFVYLDPKGDPVLDRETLSMIESLVIPPGWTDVWICLKERGHLQATGRDQRGRKQAIYHPDFRAFREETKFHRLREFGLALPKIRAAVERDMRRRGLPRDKVLAVVVRLLETTMIRVGNSRYLQENKSRGLTTLGTRHVSVGSEALHFRFRGKGGKFHEIEYRDRRLARIVRTIQDLPGQPLFQFIDEAGERRQVGSTDVNAYIREAAGEHFTAKEFRTWGATVEALRVLRDLRQEGPITKRRLNLAVRHVSDVLGNTPTICRKSYIHPRILEEALQEPDWLIWRLPRKTQWLDPHERLAIERLLD